MPMSGGTRMLRARRKDCNLKPNRRLDRKSSRGMLFENEELRMRTITINAEVEQGQHALKKLKRENEQLRREMWSLRDEYDKMEKLLRKKRAGEDSDQDTDTDENYSQTDDSDEEKQEIKTSSDQEDENPDLENEENLQKSSKFGNEANVRTFDGLSVIDEQTEETQTTESALGYGTSSGGNSGNRTLGSSLQMFDEACACPDYTQVHYNLDLCDMKPPDKKKSGKFENGFFGQGWPGVGCDTYEPRPASPYPYPGSSQNSYQKRFQVLQDLPLPTPKSVNCLGENGWIFPDPLKPPIYDENITTSERDCAENIPTDMGLCPPLPAPDFSVDLIEEKSGPDIFVADGYPKTPNGKSKSGGSFTNKNQQHDRLLGKVEEALDRMEICEKSEKDPKSKTMTDSAKSTVSQSFSGKKNSQETPHPGKLTMNDVDNENDNEISKHVQPLVSCQNSNDQDVREPIDKVPETNLEEMPLVEKPGAGSKYQTKLTVTLKAPALKGPGRLGPMKVPPPMPPKTLHHPNYSYGHNQDYSTRFQTFPNAGFQSPSPRINGRECLVSHFAGVRMPHTGLSGSLPRLPGVLPKAEIGFNASYIPVEDLEKELDVLPSEEPHAVPAANSLVKSVKIPPVPPPRTSSCPKPIIPKSSVGANAVHQRNFKKGKPFHYVNSSEHPADSFVYNPLLLSQPIATSSPTISQRLGKYGFNSSTDNLFANRYRKQSYDESSAEDLSRHKTRLREELNRVNIPKLNKSVSSPSFGSFRTVRRKPSDPLTSSAENLCRPKKHEDLNLLEKQEKKTSKIQGQNSVSVSSSSGLDLPTKSNRKKRRVSIQFKKKHSQSNCRLDDENRGRDATDSRRNSLAAAGLSAKGSSRRKIKVKNDETDGTTSERERTNSLSSHTSSFAAGSTRRKFSASSNRTYVNDEKIPWCGCWGNGCV